MSAHTRKVREVYNLLRARVPEGTMSSADLLASAHALLRLARDPEPRDHDADPAEPPPACWMVDTAMRRHPWRVASHMRHAGNGTFDDDDRRHASAWAEARRLMEYGA